MTITGVHPYADKFPMLPEPELAELAESIRANGLRNPIVLTPDGLILDGRNRAAACERVGVDPDTTDWEVITDAPECDREHLPSHSVRICLATISDDTIADLAEGAGNPSAPVADAAHRERERRRRVEGRA